MPKNVNKVLIFEPSKNREIELFLNFTIFCEIQSHTAMFQNVNTPFGLDWILGPTFGLGFGKLGTIFDADGLFCGKLGTIFDAGLFCGYNWLIFAGVFCEKLGTIFGFCAAEKLGTIFGVVS